MGIEDLIKCYQKKIGTYDKQQWEKNVEQRILGGIHHFQLKTAKPKTDLIDLDLVRGSSFTKAKPKHGFITVAKLSTLRILFLPLYSKWWVQQTSGKIFTILLVLYLLQLFNIAIYSFAPSHLPNDSIQNVPCSEVIVPIIMMWVLSFVHSQIVATNPGPDNVKVPPKFHKSYRRIRRSRKNHLSKSNESEGFTKDGKSVKLNWKSKDVLNQNGPCVKNVIFEENHVIIPNNIVKAEEIEQIKLSLDTNTNPSGRRLINGLPFEDDGFESLNGNGSSPSDNGDETLVPNKASRKPKACSTSKDEVTCKQSTSGLRCNLWVKEVQGSRKSICLSRRQSAPDLRISCGELDSDTDTSIEGNECLQTPKNERRNPKRSIMRKQVESICDTDDEGECETLSSPETVGSGQIEVTVSANEWIGVTTNSDDCSYSSEMSESDAQFENFDNDAPPTSILSPHCGPLDRVSCTIWQKREIKKADLSVFDISSIIIAKVETMPESMDYFYIGIFITVIISLLPIMCRFCYTAINSSNLDELQLSLIEITRLVFSTFSNSICDILDAMLGTTPMERTYMLVAAFQRCVLGFLLFFLLAVAERTFKQRFLYAKLFSHLTSSRRAKKSELPHFRLNKVRNIKTWLSVRSYLKKRGPLRSVDVIISAAFIVTLLLLSFLCMELLKETFVLNSQYNLEIMIWSIGLGIMVLRFMTLGVKINKKYSNLSVLTTEQINLYLQIEQKPDKKEELMVANCVLKLAADLLKELESHYKILGLSANPFLYNITKVVILSALSGVLSEILGFKLKLHKIKIK